MESSLLFERYLEMQRYVGWSDEDRACVLRLAPVVEPHLRALVEDFYEEIDRHPSAKKVITGGPVQIERLKGTLINWLRELLSGQYDADYVARRWRVGYRHVEIGLDQVYTNVALSRLRTGVLRLCQDAWYARQPGFRTPDEPIENLAAILRALNKLLDLDLAIIEDAYQTEYTLRREQAERLAAIGQVAGGIAHELRNPLNVIKTSVYYLLNAKNPSREKTAEHLARIEKQVGMADGVITVLSNFARMPLPNVQPCPVESLLHDAVEATRIPENVEIVTEPAETGLAALGDAGQLRIVLGNLIRNACEAMPKGGRLTLGARRDNSVVELSVADTGDGIAPDILPRIMEPLFSTKARGIGLGLALARAIAHKNRGQLSVASEPGRGATFVLRLPAGDSPA
jgi:signal transduction histidine kinase